MYSVYAAAEVKFINFCGGGLKLCLMYMLLRRQIYMFLRRRFAVFVSYASSFLATNSFILRKGTKRQ